jgi:hypothetical protein
MHDAILAIFDDKAIPPPRQERQLISATYSLGTLLVTPDRPLLFPKRLAWTIKYTSHRRVIYSST